jgi:Flp pilus assembly protein TadD
MDSAASEYRDHDYERAREHYSDATRLDTTLAAPWFGLFLAHRALGNVAAADSAFMTARRLAQRQ